MVLHRMIPHDESQVTFSNLLAAILSVSMSVDMLGQMFHYFVTRARGYDVLCRLMQI